MQKLKVAFQHLGKMNYQQAWDYQEKLMQENLDVKKNKRLLEDGKITEAEFGNQKIKNHFLLVEHPPVFTLGKSGAMENLLLNNDFLKQQGIEFFKTNRGGEITFHGAEQIVGYPILDLEMLKPDLVVYMRNLEEVIIRTLAEYGLQCERSDGETGVWLDVKDVWKARKICAMGVRTSRWITMHGFALNVNTDLKYFEMIIPCGKKKKKSKNLKKKTKKKNPISGIKKKNKKTF